MSRRCEKIMRKNNKCSVNIVGGEVYACCMSYSDDCTYGEYVNSSLLTDNKNTCCWYRGLQCRNKEATNKAATRMVKKLRQKYGTDD